MLTILIVLGNISDCHSDPTFLFFLTHQKSLGTSRWAKYPQMRKIFYTNTKYFIRRQLY